MNDLCPSCGLGFSREPGFFLGAMFFSYALATLILVPLTGLAYLIIPRWSFLRLVGLSWLICLPMVPWIFRTSRLLWLHLDQWIDPRAEVPRTPVR